MQLVDEIAGCRLCAARFAATNTGHEPRPVAWFRPGTRILIAGQAPGMRVHQTGKPFDDPSGDRLRDWLGIGPEEFYDRARVSILPMAFCFPGYNAKASDLPPPSKCAATWRDRAEKEIGKVPLTVLIGAYAQKWHLDGQVPVAKRVADWRLYAPAVFPVPHPSWRNSAWLRGNPWFADDLLPALRAAVERALV